MRLSAKAPSVGATLLCVRLFRAVEGLSRTPARVSASRASAPVAVHQLAQLDDLARLQGLGLVLPKLSVDIAGLRTCFLPVCPALTENLAADSPVSSLARRKRPVSHETTKEMSARLRRRADVRLKREGLAVRWAMAIYPFQREGEISRANGSSAGGGALHRSASELHDERLGRSHNPQQSRRRTFRHPAPEGSPERWQDRQTRGTKRRSRSAQIFQLGPEVEFSIPRELDQAQGIELARDFVQREFVDRGMVADLNVHWDVGPEGSAKPHAHVMLSMREDFVLQASAHSCPRVE